MATEEVTAVTEQKPTLTKYICLVAALFGVWAIISPFILSGPIESGIGFWNNFATGAIAFLLGTYSLFRIKQIPQIPSISTGEMSALFVALLGVYIAATPFVLLGDIGEGVPLWSNLIAGGFIVLLGAHAAFFVHENA